MLDREDDMRSVSFPLMTLSAFGALGLYGCAGFSQDGGFNAVADATRSQLNKDVEWPRTPEEERKVESRVAELLSSPLTAEDAVQIALLNNHRLRAEFQELGISEADLVQAGRSPIRGSIYATPARRASTTSNRH